MPVGARFLAEFWSVSVRFTIPFAPVAKARARSVYMPGRGVRHYTPKNTADWESTVAGHARLACRTPLDGPITLSLGFYLPIPVSWPNWKRDAALSGEIAPTSKPDLDNLEKSIKDACNGIAWVDDAQAVRVNKWKFYSDHPRVEVIFEPMKHLLPAQVTRRPIPQEKQK